jgi:hypothetical protein
MTLEIINSPKKSIFELISQMVADAHAGLFDKEFDYSGYNQESFDLMSYLNHFVELPESAFSQELENKLAEYFNEHISGLLRSCGNQTMVITLAPTPFSFPGRQLTPNDYFDEAEANIPLSPSYLTILYSDASANHGLCKARGWLKSMPFLSLLPAEIREKCSVKLSSDLYFQNPTAFEVNIRKAYRELQALIDQYHQNKKKA